MSNTASTSSIPGAYDTNASTRKHSHKEGFSITIAHTTFNAPDPSTHPDFDFHFLSDNLSASNLTNGGELSFLESLNVNCKSPLQELVTHMMGQEQQEVYGKLVGIVYDSLGYFAEAVPKYFKIPCFDFCSSPSSFLLAYRAMPRLQGEGFLPCKGIPSFELI